MQAGLNELNLLIFIAFVIFCSPYISKLTKLPILAVEIILGAIAGWLNLISKTPLFTLSAQVGFCYLMFIAGLEVSLREFLKLSFDEFKRIMFFYVILYAISFIICIIFHLSYINVVIFPAMSVGLISILFKDYAIVPKWLTFTMICAALGEVISIVAITLVNSFSNSTTYMEVFFSVFYIVFFLGVFVLIYYFINALFWWLPWLKELLMPDFDKSERNVRLSLALWMIAVALMLKFDFEIALGAFLAGMLLSSFFGHKKDLESKLSSLGHSFLIPIFFVHVGLSIDFNLVNKELILLACSIVFAMIFIRLVGSVLFYVLFKRHCFLVAFASCMPLTLLIAIATLGEKLSLISNKLYLAMVLSALIEGVVFMWFIPKLANYLDKLALDNND